MKKFLAIFLSLLIFFTCTGIAEAASVSDFYDVSPGEWFYDYVKFVTEKGMFNGTSGNTFSPNGKMTRGMFVTVLGRYGNAPTTVSGGQLGITTKTDVNMRSGPSTNGTQVVACLPINSQVEFLSSCPDSQSPEYTWNKVIYKGKSGYIRSDLMQIIDSGFSDVPEDAYYAPYVQWAFSSGIAYESGAGTFSPERDITREEICSMLYNFSSFKNLRLKPTVTATSFNDSGAISQNYKTAVSMMQQIGVVGGYDDGSFKPQNGASRAEVAAMLKRYIGAISYKPVSEPSLDANGNYIFGTEVPARPSVGEGYFSDACFIGHSLVVGLKNYAKLTNADYLAFNGASSKSLMSYTGFPLSTTHTDESGNQVPDTGTLSQALSESSYGKVYIMLGANEIGTQAYHKQAFYNNMSSLIDLVRKSQPNAAIYLISMTPVSQKCSENRADLNRDNILIYNDVIKQLCKDKRAYYLNVFDLIANGDGYLNENASVGDGIHILSQQYLMIRNYLMTHAF